MLKDPKHSETEGIWGFGGVKPPMGMGAKRTYSVDTMI